MRITPLDWLKKVYAGTDLLINRKIQAFYYALLSLVGAMLIYGGISLLFSFPFSQRIFVLIRYVPLLLFAFFLFLRGKYDVALWVSYFSFLIPLTQIALTITPVTRETVYFVTLTQSIGILYLTLLTHKRRQIVYGAMIALGVEGIFLLSRILIPFGAIPAEYISNLIAAALILLVQSIISFLIHSLLYASLSEIMFQVDFNRETGIPNEHSMIGEISRITRLDKYMDLVFYRVENLNELRLRLGEWTTSELIKKTAVLLETEHQCDCYQVNGSTLAIFKRDPMTPVGMETDRIMESLKNPLPVGELSVQVFLRSCQTRAKIIGDPRVLLDRGLRGLKKASLDNKKRIFFTDEEEKIVQENMNLIHELGTSLLEGSCYPVYQGIFDERGDIASFESLTRWTRHDGTDISPDIFIPFLEQSGLMADFFFRMFKKILEDMKRNPGYFGENRVFVNLSPELINGGFDFERMLSLIEEANIEKTMIGFEVTESTILRANHFLIALDDFGTGYSNITQILDLPIQKIKFDKSFIQGILAEPQKRDLCSSLMGHFHKYGYITVAEGVETREQLELLRSLHCRQYQGYLLGKPGRPE